LFALVYVFTFFQEIIPVYEGVGYDGLKYNKIAQEGVEIFKNRTIEGYHLLRYVPFVFYDILELPPETSKIILFFKIFNAICVIIAVIYFFKIAHFFKWKESIVVLGFILMFFSFPILKLINFYPLLTDHLSFTLSIIGIYAYFTRNHFLTLVVLFLSLFNLPTLTFVLLLLNFLDDRNKLKLFSLNKSKFTLIIKLVCVLLIGFPLLLCINIANKIPNPVYSGVSLNTLYLPISMVCLMIYFIYLVWVLNIVRKEESKTIEVKGNLFYFILAIIMYGIMYWIFESFPPMPNTGMPTIQLFGFRALIMPLNFYVYHVFYFGLLMAISLVFAKKIFIESLKLGIGWLVVVILFYLFAIQNESRGLLNLIIFIAIPVLQWINKSGGINKIKLIIFLAISLLVSRFFLKLNHTPDMWKLMENPNEFLKFPVQRYFMNFGPWVSYDMYFLQAIIFICVLVMAFFLFRKNIYTKKVLDESEKPHLN
jgi:hypothetical protein